MKKTTKPTSIKWRAFLGVVAFAVAAITAPFTGVQVANAAAGEAVWTGAGGDSKFSTAANWEGSTLPVAGDVIVFSVTPVVAQNQYFQPIDNDIDVVFGGLATNVANWPSTNYTGFELQKDIRLGANPVFSLNGPGVAVSNLAKVMITGDFTFSDTAGRILRMKNVDVAGTITYPSGTSDAKLPAAAGNIIIQKGAVVWCNAPTENSTFPSLVLGTGTGADPVFTPACGMGGQDNGAYSITFNKVTLESNAQIGVSSPHQIIVNELIANGFSLTRPESADGQLILPTGVIENQASTTQLDGDMPNENVFLADKETGVLNGTRSTIYLGAGSVLKGQGTVNSLTANPGAIVSPGMSPGTITVLQSLFLADGSVYQAEILNKDAYDKIVLSEAATTASIGNAVLDLQFLPGGTVAQGEAFTILDNRSQAPISGTFVNLAEGAQITIGDAVFSISYVGGDGNDIVLTALVAAKAPDAPNTGVARILLANPTVPVVLGLVTAAVLILAVRRTRNN